MAIATGWYGPHDNSSSTKNAAYLKLNRTLYIYEMKLPCSVVVCHLLVYTRVLPVPNKLCKFCKTFIALPGSLCEFCKTFIALSV